MGELTTTNQADGKPPTLPIQVLVSLSDAYTAFNPREAARSLAEHAKEIPSMASKMRSACVPVSHRDLTQRLTALGMTMAPNRASAEATMWLHEMTRLLSDLPKDILFHAIDECQRVNRFLPTIAEIRAIADPMFEERKKHASRLAAILNVMDGIEPPAAQPETNRLCRPDQAEQILREYGLLDAVRRA